MRKRIILTAMFMLSLCMAYAQKVYTYVQQDGKKVSSLGTAAFDVTGNSHPIIEFDSKGQIVMYIKYSTVAVVPMSDNGQLAIEFEGTAENVKKTVSNGYATLYSPFQLQVPGNSNVAVYAPSYDNATYTLSLADDRKVAAETIIPAGTGLILKNNGDIEFALSAGNPGNIKSALSGSALKTANPTKSGAVNGKTVYALGHEKTSKEFGFCAYTGDYLNPGYAYLLAPTMASGSSKAISFDFGETTGVEQMTTEDRKMGNGKYLEMGRIVIVNNGQKYNVNGQKVR